MGFRKEGGFGGGHKKSFGGQRFGGKKSFGHGGGGGRNDEQREMFSAVCATCGKTCEVPFRPTGERPVYCRDCFGGKAEAPRGDYGRRDNARSFEPRRSASTFTPRQKPQGDDRRFDEMKRQIDAVHNKLDVVVRMIEALTPVESYVVSEDKPVKPTKKAPKTKVVKK